MRYLFHIWYGYSLNQAFLYDLSISMIILCDFVTVTLVGRFRNTPLGKQCALPLKQDKPKTPFLRL